MSDYSRIELRVRLKPDTPEAALHTLREMTSRGKAATRLRGKAWQHRFVATMLSATSTYHATSGSTLTEVSGHVEFKASASIYRGDGIWSFIDWLSPWVERNSAIVGFVDSSITSSDDQRWVLVAMPSVRTLTAIRWQALDQERRLNPAPRSPASRLATTKSRTGAALLADPSIVTAVKIAQGPETTQDRVCAGNYLAQVMVRSGAFQFV